MPHTSDYLLQIRDAIKRQLPQWSRGHIIPRGVILPVDPYLTGQTRCAKKVGDKMPVLLPNNFFRLAKEVKKNDTLIQIQPNSMGYLGPGYLISLAGKHIVPIASIEDNEIIKINLSMGWPAAFNNRVPSNTGSRIALDSGDFGLVYGIPTRVVGSVPQDENELAIRSPTPILMEGDVLSIPTGLEGYFKEYEIIEIISARNVAAGVSQVAQLPTSLSQFPHAVNLLGNPILPTNVQVRVGNVNLSLGTHYLVSGFTVTFLPSPINVGAEVTISFGDSDQRQPYLFGIRIQNIPTRVELPPLLRSVSRSRGTPIPLDDADTVYIRAYPAYVSRLLPAPRLYPGNKGEVGPYLLDRVSGILTDEAFGRNDIDEISQIEQYSGSGNLIAKSVLFRSEPSTDEVLNSQTVREFVDLPPGSSQFPYSHQLSRVPSPGSLPVVSITSGILSTPSDYVYDSSTRTIRFILPDNFVQSFTLPTNPSLYPFTADLIGTPDFPNTVKASTSIGQILSRNIHFTVTGNQITFLLGPDVIGKSVTVRFRQDGVRTQALIEYQTTTVQFNGELYGTPTFNVQPRVTQQIGVWNSPIGGEHMILFDKMRGEISYETEVGPGLFGQVSVVPTINQGGINLLGKRLVLECDRDGNAEIKTDLVPSPGANGELIPEFRMTLESTAEFTAGIAFITNNDDSDASDLRQSTSGQACPHQVQLVVSRTPTQADARALTIFVRGTPGQKVLVGPLVPDGSSTQFLRYKILLKGVGSYMWASSGLLAKPMFLSSRIADGSGVEVPLDSGYNVQTDVTGRGLK